jgi:hypothetical protein
VIAIEMCRAYPALRVVGLEPAQGLAVRRWRRSLQRAFQIARLRNTLWGSSARLAEEVAEAVRQAGFTQVQVRHVGGLRYADVGRRPE